MRLALKLLAALRCGSGSTPMRGSCQLITEGCWFIPGDNLFLQLWKLTAIYKQKLFNKNVVKHTFTLIFKERLTMEGFTTGTCGTFRGLKLQSLWGLVIWFAFDAPTPPTRLLGFLSEISITHNLSHFTTPP